MDIVKYHNSINYLKLGELKEREMDILFSLMFKARDKGTDEINLSYHDISKLIDLESNRDRVPNYIVGLATKLKGLNQMITKPNGDIVLFGLFDKITIKVNEKMVVVKVNEEFSYMLNDLIGNYTMFDLKELVKLNGNYPKTLFRLLKQWESTKELIILMEDFRKLMNIPVNYEQFNINQKVLKPCLDQLQQHFKGLKIEKLKKGVKIDRLKFTWEERTIKRDIPSTGLTAEDYQKLYPEEKVETIITEEKSAVDLALINLRKKAQGQAKSKLTQSRYFEFHARVIPLKSEKEIEELCREFGFLLNEELFTE